MIVSLPDIGRSHKIVAYHLVQDDYGRWVATVAIVCEEYVSWRYVGTYLSRDEASEACRQYTYTPALES